MRAAHLLLTVAVSISAALTAVAQKTLTLDQAVALAKERNPEIMIARKQVDAARGGRVEARAGVLPSVLSTGLLRKRENAEESRLRDDDYNASLRVVQNIYSGGAVRARNVIARLNQERRELELAAITNRVSMDLRVAYYDLLLNRSKIGVQEEALGVMQDELKAQQERFVAGTVGEINVLRAEVSLANEQPDLADAQTRLQNSYLRLNELVGAGTSTRSRAPQIEISGKLEYLARRPDLAECLAYASTSRHEIKARQLEVEIEDQQLIIDRAELKPRVEAFTGYEVYSERDPEVGGNFNHGYVIGLNASWHIFDGYATRGRIIATQARREAAVMALQAQQLAVESEVRSAFFDLQQANRILQSETQNVQNASESLEIARSNLTAGLGTQLDVLQAAADVTRVRTTRLSAIYLHNVALARLARATAREPEQLGFAAKIGTLEDAQRQAQAFEMARPPSALGGRK